MDYNKTIQNQNTPPSLEQQFNRINNLTFNSTSMLTIYFLTQILYLFFSTAKNIWMTFKQEKMMPTTHPLPQEKKHVWTTKN